MNSRKKEGELWNRLQEISKLSKPDHLEEHQKDIIQRLITKYQEVFSLDTETLPCTNLTQHEIVLKSGKIINLRSHKLPEKHREYLLQETEKLSRKGIIRESQLELPNLKRRWRGTVPTHRPPAVAPQLPSP